MNSARMTLKLVLDRAGISDIDLSTFSQRFNIQKRIYLIQIVGQDLGYRYGWYIKGPYSRGLTADAFTLRDELTAGQKDDFGVQLTPIAVSRIGQAESLWNYPGKLSVKPDQWLELLASLHYLKHIAYWPPGSNKDFEAVFKALVEAKPQFQGEKPAARKAWDRLDEFGLIGAKTLA